MRAAIVGPAAGKLASRIALSSRSYRAFRALRRAGQARTLATVRLGPLRRYPTLSDRVRPVRRRREWPENRLPRAFLFSGDRAAPDWTDSGFLRAPLFAVAGLLLVLLEAEAPRLAHWAEARTAIAGARVLALSPQAQRYLLLQYRSYSTKFMGCMLGVDTAQSKRTHVQPLRSCEAAGWANRAPTQVAGNQLQHEAQLP
jgi:hypothetical protein